MRFSDLAARAASTVMAATVVVGAPIADERPSAAPEVDTRARDLEFVERARLRRLDKQRRRVSRSGPGASGGV